jgi:hypothetical protein
MTTDQRNVDGSSRPDCPTWEEQVRDRVAHAVMYHAAAERCLSDLIVLLDLERRESEPVG